MKTNANIKERKKEKERELCVMETGEYNYIVYSRFTT